MALELIDLKRSYGDFSVSLNITVSDGETLALVGPSGSGKTTALNLIAGLSLPDSGKLICGGEDISALPPWKRNISLVFQDLALFPHLNVGGNIAYSLFLRRVKTSERRRIVEETLKTVRLPDYTSRRIHTLSGGERQRIAIARSLACSPRALLMDEPFSSLDAPLRKELHAEFLEIRSHSAAPCVFVTHDREEALSLGDRIALMADGSIIESGSGRDLFLSPKTEFTARFFGAGQILPCKILGKNASGTEVTCPFGMLTVPYSAQEQSDFKLFIPNDAVSLEDLSPASGWKNFSAKCSQMIFNGPNIILKFFLPDSNINIDSADQSDENSFFEILAGPRTKNVSPGSVVDFWINQNILSFVKTNYGV